WLDAACEASRRRAYRSKSVETAPLAICDTISAGASGGSAAAIDRSIGLAAAENVGYPHQLPIAGRARPPGAPLCRTSPRFSSAFNRALLSAREKRRLLRSADRHAMDPNWAIIAIHRSLSGREVAKRVLAARSPDLFLRPTHR